MTTQPDNLPAWLAHSERQHTRPIALGLDRVREVSRRLGQRQTCPLILVGGTNGKGSTCAMLERILLCAGYRVGLYTSPHLLAYNERVRIDGAAVEDEPLCAGFARVEAARIEGSEIPLTYFEFGTLAAWEVFAAQSLDVIILEVGLGGRLDATNIYEPDVAIVTGVDMDHMDYLGGTREAIGFEKAGIFRAGKPAICGDADPPASLVEHCRAASADFLLIGRDFGFSRSVEVPAQWQYWGPGGKRSGLAFPALRGAVQLGNAACVLAALDTLRAKLPVAMQEIRRGLLEVELPGRFQVVPGRPALVLDVAHNPQAAGVLADGLGNMGGEHAGPTQVFPGPLGGERRIAAFSGGASHHPVTWAVFGMLADKDIPAVIEAIKHRVDVWLPCTLDGPRAASADFLAQALEAAGCKVGGRFTTPAEALREAQARANEDDRIVAFGSFLTVAEVLRARAPKRMANGENFD